MCSPTRETHIPSDWCSPTWETCNHSDMCSPTWKHISLVICVPPPGNHVSLGICILLPGKHISLVICVPPPGNHVSQVACVLLPGKHISLVISIAPPPLPAPSRNTCLLLSLILLLLKIFLTTLGIGFVLSVPNREYNFVRVRPNNKVLPVYVWLIWFAWWICPKQGSKLRKGIYVMIFFCPKQGQGFNLSSAHLYPNTGQVPTPWGTNQWHVETLLFDLFWFLGDDVPAHLYGKTEFGDNVDNEWFIVSLLLQLSKVFPETCIRWDNYTLSGIYSSNET